MNIKTKNTTSKTSKKEGWRPCRGMLERKAKSIK